MDHILKRVGGARVGWVNATMPMAVLTASAERLALKVALLGTYTFSREQVVSFETLGWGIRVHHNVANYPRKIIFWTFGSPSRLVQEIETAGFTPAAPPESVPEVHGIAVRWQALVVLVLAWNALCLLDVFLLRRQPFGWGVLTAVSGLFVGSIAVRHAPSLQDLILKPGRSVVEIGAWLRLLTLVSGFLLLGITVQLLLRRPQ